MGSKVLNPRSGCPTAGIHVLQPIFIFILLVNFLWFPSQEEHIKSVTKEFCDWVSSLGGESNNIEESTITSLFASGYETKPALSVPIHVVELTNVPPELRMSSAVPTQQPNKNLPTKADKKKEWVSCGMFSYVYIGVCRN